MEKEMWKQVEEFEFFEISSHGRLRSLTHKCGGKIWKGQIISPQSSNRGEKRVKLSVEGIVYTRLIHRLVAIAFISNSENLPEVNHIDGIPSNNYYKNLEWCTHQYNMAHASSTGLLKRWNLEILQYNLEGVLINTFKNARQAAKHTGISRYGIMSNLEKDTPMKKYPFNFKKGKYNYEKTTREVCPSISPQL